MTLAEKIKSPGPKKILTLDGGGIRGMITVEILAGIEALLRRMLNDEKLVLSDWFDFFAGTSTGAIIATCLAMGKTTDEIRSFYIDSGKDMFDRSHVLRRYRSFYEDKKLAQKLQEVFGEETTLGSNEIKTLLMMVMRNASTDSPWPLSNNPFAKYNQSDRPDCNLNIPLWQLVRASTAAPCYFPPELINTKTQEFVFVDGGITPYNNPAFQSFMMATVEPYHLEWETGEDKLLVVSIGTGTSPAANENLNPDDMNILYNAKSVPSALMSATVHEQDFLCRTFGNCLAGDPLDREIGDMIGKRGPVNPRLFTYVRYNAELSRSGLNELGLTTIFPEKVQKLDSVEFIGDLQRVGQAVVEKKVKAEHFKGFM